MVARCFGLDLQAPPVAEEAQQSQAQRSLKTSGECREVRSGNRKRASEAGA